MAELSKLPNIGPVLEQQLIDIGVTSYNDLKELGAEATWLKIQQIDESACIHRLLALEGAIQNVKKTQLPEARKLDLKEFYNQHKK